MTRVTSNTRTPVRPVPGSGARDRSHAISRTAGGRRSLRSLGAVVALAVVVTAGAPSVIEVGEGDTLWDLARRHGTTVAALERLNDLPGNGLLQVGATLRVPGADHVRTSDQGVYRVRSGDTLGGLALRFSTTTAALRKANNLTGNRIRIGQALRIPVAGRGGGVASVPTTNAGKRIPDTVRRSVAENRRILAARSHPSKAQVRRLVAAAARRYGVPTSLAVAVAFHESGFQQRVVSPVNAIGVMQVLPATGRVLSAQHGRHLDLLKAQDNVTAGVLLLRQLLRSTGSADRTLAGYYQGLGSIARKGILPQTRTYIRNVNALRPRFAHG